MFPPQRSGLRSTMIHDLVPLHHAEWVTPRTYSMHRPKYRDAANCDMMFVNSAFTRDDVIGTLGSTRARVLVAPPGVDAEFGPRRRAAELGAPYVLTVATLEPRKNLQVLVDAHRLADGRPARRRRRRRLGRTAVARPARHSCGSAARATRARPALPRRSSRGLPVSLRGLRDADRRGDGERRTGGRVVACRRWTRRPATWRCVPIPTTRPLGAAPWSRRRPTRGARTPRARARPPVHLAPRRARPCSGGERAD